LIRLLLRLFGIKDFEVCQSCETLKQQLSYERSEKQRLTDTLLQIISPKVVESIPVEINPIINTSGTFARRRAALEAKDRAEAQILREKKYIGIPDDHLTKSYSNDGSIENLEKELGVEEKAN
jgi:hypothetical protein